MAESGVEGLVLRAAERADVPVLLDLIRALARYERLEHEVVATEADLAASLFSSPPRAQAVLAELDGRAVGLALWFHNFSTFTGRPGLYLEDLYVAPEHRGRGIGRALLAHLARRAVETGCARFEWAVLDWNEKAIRFYRALGARPMDQWTVQRLSGEALAALAAEDGR